MKESYINKLLRLFFVFTKYVFEIHPSIAYSHNSFIFIAEQYPIM